MPWPTLKTVPYGQLVQEMAAVSSCAEEQVAHEPWHATHAPVLATLLEGHAATQAPSSYNGVPTAGQVRHEALPEPLQVSHDGWQSWQVTWLGLVRGS